MSPPSKRKKGTSKAIPSLKADLKAIGTVATKMESTHRSLRIYSSEHPKPIRLTGRFKKTDN
jgi:hypothetical protein